MAILQGNTYKLPIVIKDSNGKIVNPDVVDKASFTFGSITKTYGEDVYFDDIAQAWIIPLTEQETFSLRGTIKWQARFCFTDGSIDGTLPKNEEVFSSIDRTLLNGGGE